MPSHNNGNHHVQNLLGAGSFILCLRHASHSNGCHHLHNILGVGSVLMCIHGTCKQWKACVMVGIEWKGHIFCLANRFPKHDTWSASCFLIIFCYDIFFLADSLFVHVAWILTRWFVHSIIWYGKLYKVSLFFLLKRKLINEQSLSCVMQMIVWNFELRIFYYL